MYASQNFEFIESRTTTFPFDNHRQNLESVLSIRPRVVVPGSAGFRFSGDHEWLNAFLFPISRERFAADFNQLDPSIATHIVNPGDISELCDGRVSYHPQASQTAVTTEDDTSQIRFDPTAPIPALSDPNPDGYSSTLLTEVTERFVTQGLRTFVRDGYQSRKTIVTQYRELRASYAIVVVFPDATEACRGCTERFHPRDLLHARRQW